MTQPYPSKLTSASLPRMKDSSWCPERCLPGRMVQGTPYRRVGVASQTRQTLAGRGTCLPLCVNLG